MIRHDPKLTGKGLATAGLIIGYATLIFSLGSAALIPIIVKRENRVERPPAQASVPTNAPASQPAGPQMDTNESQQAQSGNGTGWTLDVKDATIPASPVSGEIHGANFQLRRVLFRNRNLRFISADGQESLIIHDLGDSAENRSMEFQTASGNDAPKIEITWKEDGENKTETFENGYAMELKIDGARGRRIPGQIYLCLPDDSKSYIAGTFTITLPRPKPKPAPATQFTQ